MQNTKKRALVTSVNGEIDKLAKLDPVTTIGIDLDGLKTSFAALVAELMLGDEPATRPCPHCGKLGMRAASVCGFCWTKTARAAA
jgi:hypothetical protein